MDTRTKFENNSLCVANELNYHNGWDVDGHLLLFNARRYSIMVF